MHDVIVIGSGPNGLSAAIRLAQAGWSVLVLEAAAAPGGSVRSEELTLPGFVHDVGAAAFPLAAASPFFRSLQLERHGLKWLNPDVPLAHPFPGGQAAATFRSLAVTAEHLGTDGKAYAELLAPLVAHADELAATLLAPPRLPDKPLLLAAFGQHGARSALGLGRSMFHSLEAQTLFAGQAAHSTLPLTAPLTAGFGLLLATLAHARGWPIPEGGSGQLSAALVAKLKRLGGEIRMRALVRSMRDLPPARYYLFDTAPAVLASIAEDALPSAFVRRLRRHRYGPGIFKADFALDKPIPWRAEICRSAPVIHLGDTAAAIAASERAVWHGSVAAQPFTLLGQPTVIDPNRAPPGKAIAWAYCHVPFGWRHDMSSAIEAQIERHAPGFQASILARRAWLPRDLESANANLVGGTINGGVQDARTFLEWSNPVSSPYATPNPAIFQCSASTPPGGGVHGMCGYWAAETMLAQRSYRNAQPCLSVHV